MAYNLFLRIDGIQGDSKQAGHEDEIELLSFSWGVTNAPTTTGAAAGSGVSKPRLSDLSVTKFSDKASPALFRACASGQHVKTVTLTCRRTDGQDYFKIELVDVLVSDYVVGGHANSDTEDVPLDQVSLHFQKIDLQLLPEPGLFGSPTVGQGPLTAPQTAIP